MRRNAEYHWCQEGSVGTDNSGCALGVRKEFAHVVDFYLRVGSPQTSEGGGIGERSIVRAMVKRQTTKSGGPGLRFGAAAGHAPPPRAPRARARFMAAYVRVPAMFKGGDINMPMRMAMRALNRRVVGHGVLWLTIPRKGWSVVSSKAIDVGGDHKAVLAVVEHKETKRHVRFLVINCMSVSASPFRAASILARGLDHDPHIVMASECKDIRAADAFFNSTQAVEKLAAINEDRDAVLTKDQARSLVDALKIGFKKP